MELGVRAQTHMTLPFTRMFLGPMDFTPGAMRNATRATFCSDRGRAHGNGHALDQLAMYVVFDNPLDALDTAVTILRDPTPLEFLAAVPTTWDETRVLDAKIAAVRTVARKNGKDWYLGAMTDWTRAKWSTFLFAPRHFSSTSMRTASSGPMPATTATKDPGDKATKLNIMLARDGGWAARISPRKLRDEPRCASSYVISKLRLSRRAVRVDRWGVVDSVPRGIEGPIATASP